MIPVYGPNYIEQRAHDFVEASRANLKVSREVAQNNRFAKSDTPKAKKEKTLDEEILLNPSKFVRLDPSIASSLSVSDQARSHILASAP